MGRAAKDVGYVPPIEKDDAHKAAVNIAEWALKRHGKNPDKVVAVTAELLEELGIKEMCDA